jgi:hypothetical protein
MQKFEASMTSVRTSFKGKAHVTRSVFTKTFKETIATKLFGTYQGIIDM